jgi:hypothetical protein
VQLDADSSEDAEANSEKIRRFTTDVATQGADPAPIDDGVTSPISTALAGFEPTGGLHPLANEPGVAPFAGPLAALA